MRRMLGNTFPSSVTSTPTSSLDKTRNDILSDPIIQINQNRHLNSLEDEFLPNRLPFGAARLEPHYKHQPSPSQSSAVSTRTSSNLHRTHHYSGSATLTENSSRHSHTSDSSRSHPFSGPDLKSKMMLQLLSSQAIIEASAFQILPFGRVEQLKKDQIKLERRLASISSKLLLETKIRDATLTIIESDVTQNDSQLDHSHERVDQLSQEQYALQTQLIDTRTKLLQHLSAILSLSLNKVEQNSPSEVSGGSFIRSTATPAPNLRHRHERSPTPSPTGSSHSTLPPSDRFEGLHLFANNRDGITPHHPPTVKSLDHSLTSQGSPVVDTGQMARYEKTLALQTRELDQLRSEVANLRQQRSQMDTDNSSHVSDDMERALREKRELQREFERVKQAEQAHARELEQLRQETAALASDLKRERSTLNGDKQDLTTQSRQADDRAQEAESQQRRLEIELERLRSQLDTVQEAKESLQTQLVALQATFAGLADQNAQSERQQQELNQQVTGLISDQETAQSRTTHLEASVTQLELDKSTLHDTVRSLEVRLAQERQKHDDDVRSQANDSLEWDELFNGLRRLIVPSTASDSSLVQFLKTHESHQDRSKWVAELISHLNAHFVFVEAKLTAAQDVERELRAGLETGAEAQSKDRSTSSTRVAELEAKLTELEAKLTESEASHRSTNNAEAASSEAEIQNLKEQLDAADQQIENSTAIQAESSAMDKTLRDLFKILPAPAEMRARLELDADVGTFRPALEQPKKATGGLGGLFGLGKRAVTPPVAVGPEEVDYSFDGFVDRIKLLAEGDKKLVERLMKHESDKEQYKANALRAQKLAEESREALQTYQQQVKELEERLEYSDTQSAAMLEKFNDIMESEEKANAIARRAEASMAQLQAQMGGLSQEAQSLQNRVLELESKEMEADDLMDEIENMKQKEVKTRHQFMADLEESQNETSALRLKLRQAERRV